MCKTIKRTKFHIHISYHPLVQRENRVVKD
uniref:Uncharacterized protein n=1 Tax=Arundo donax TaxID=35708 RepID=A0A0A9FXS5_ARUDO